VLFSSLMWPDLNKSLLLGHFSLWRLSLLPLTRSRSKWCSSFSMHASSYASILITLRTFCRVIATMSCEVLVEDDCVQPGGGMSGGYQALTLLSS